MIFLNRTQSCLITALALLANFANGQALHQAGAALDPKNAPTVFDGLPVTPRDSPTAVIAGAGQPGTEGNSSTQKIPFDPPASVTGSSHGNAAPPAITDSSAPLNVLQKHVLFFDENRDGIVEVGETAGRLQKLKQPKLKSWITALLIHLGLSSATTGEWFTTDIVIANIHRAKHPGDTDIYDDEGRFNPAAFDLMFDNFDQDRSDAIDELEMKEMLKANAASRPGRFGEIASKFEFQALMDIGADRKKMLYDAHGEKEEISALSRGRLKSFYDGTLFFVLAGEQAPF